MVTTEKIHDEIEAIHEELTELKKDVVFIKELLTREQETGQNL